MAPRNTKGTSKPLNTSPWIKRTCPREGSLSRK
jgi:hypothetical protein